MRNPLSDTIVTIKPSGIRKFFDIVSEMAFCSSLHMIVCFFLAAGAFYYRNVPALIALLLFSAMEAYILLRKAVEHYQILQGVEEIADGDLSAKIDVEELHGEDRKLAETINNIGAGLLHAVDDSTKNERMKADLITNVSHDIKTPLTSIINYVNLIQREDVDNERVKNYVKILDEKSQRLKQLTEDLVEASKVSSGNVKLEMHKIDIVELVCQTGGEFNEKFEDKELTIVTKLPRQAVYIWSDGRHLYRVIENLYNNVAKYALQKTRVYVEVQADEERAVFSIKNVSARSLARENSEVEDLTERFIRGPLCLAKPRKKLGWANAGKYSPRRCIARRRNKAIIKCRSCKPFALFLIIFRAVFKRFFIGISIFAENKLRRQARHTVFG